MAQRTHGIKGMRSVPCSRSDSAFSRGEVGVRMSQTDAHTSPHSFGNDLNGALQFRSNRHHANAAARRLPELFEQGQRGRQQVLRRVSSTTHMADEGPFEMD